MRQGYLIGWLLLLIFVGGVANAGNIAILRDDFPRSRSFSDPTVMAKTLQKAGYGVDLINSQQLADSGSFNSGKYALVILPYGGYFPAFARDNFLTFLRDGGDFLSTGGYAFDEMAMKWQGRWVSRSEARFVFPVREIKIGSAGDQWYLTGTWYMPERTGDITKRWSGRMAGLRIPVKPGTAYDVEIDLSTNPKASKYSKYILINGKRVYKIPSIEDQIIKLKVSPQQIGNRRTIDIVFDAQLWRPSEIDKSPDTRSLGVAVRRITLNPHGKQMQIPDISFLRKPINMRFGAPNDFLEWQPEQLGVFDAGYKFNGGRAITSAAEQYIIPDTYIDRGACSGWAAVGTTGTDWYYTTPSDRSRLIPLLDTRDEYGRFKGNAGAIMVNYSGPYKGSTWAYFGIENRDIFAGQKGSKLLLSVINAMAAGTFLHEAHPSMACYRQGEEASVIASASNFGSTAGSFSAAVEIKNEAGDTVYRDNQTFRLLPGQSQEVKVNWKPDRFDDDFYTVKMTLFANGKPVDSQKTGFYVWNDKTAADGLKLTYKDNYLQDNGRPRFLLGSQAFYPWKAVTAMDPLHIERDFASMSDLGLHISRTFTCRADLRFIDALVMASQRHHVVFFIEGLADPRIAPESMKTEIDYAAMISERYKGIPGMIVDIRNEPVMTNTISEQPTLAAFARYLKSKYGTTESLRNAWGKELETGEDINTVKLTTPKGEWSSIRARDTYRFLNEAGKNWVDSITASIKSKDPGRLVTVGYLQWWQDMTMDPAVTSDSLDFTNRHWYGTVDELKTWEAQFMMSDRRYRGKAPSIGEFGSKTFPTFAESNHNFDTVNQQEERFLHMGHYALGLGGIFMNNWHYRDPFTNIFPYGIVYSDWNLKPVAKAYRAMSMLFSQFQPRYTAPDTYLVLPDESRFGGDSAKVFGAIQSTAEIMLNANIKFGCINEWDIQKLPVKARTLVMPAAYTVSDQAYDYLVNWVRNGGVLKLSNDIDYNTDRKPSDSRKFKGISNTGVVFYSNPLELRAKDSKYPSGIRVMPVDMENGQAVIVGNETENASRVTVVINNQKHTLTVGSHRQAALVYINGKLAGLEAQGEVERAGKVIARSDGHFFVISLDGNDIAKTARMSAVLLHGSRLALNTRGISTQAGEVKNGRWHILSSLTVNKNGSINVPASLNGEMILFAAHNDLDKAGDLAAELMTK